MSILPKQCLHEHLSANLLPENMHLDAVPAQAHLRMMMCLLVDGAPQMVNTLPPEWMPEHKAKTRQCWCPNGLFCLASPLNKNVGPPLSYGVTRRRSPLGPPKSASSWNFVLWHTSLRETELAAQLSAANRPDRFGRKHSKTRLSGLTIGDYRFIFSLSSFSPGIRNNKVPSNGPYIWSPFAFNLHYLSGPPWEPEGRRSIDKPAAGGTSYLPHDLPTQRIQQVGA
jgi:hypothetical protein